jgi:hypothetical protein
MVAAPACAACGSPSARVELIAPGKLPAEWERWSQDARDAFRRYRDPVRWWLLFDGVAAGNGAGDAVSAVEAARIAEAFGVPYSYDRVHAAGFCQRCGVPYCRRHWQVTRSGYGYCPEGHGKSLDPHWSPDDSEP